VFAAIAKISQLGRPIWITELNWALNVRNDTLRAHLADLTLRELYSNPLVHHIALQHIVPSFGQTAATCPTCLFDENNVPNEVGQVFLNLRKEWSTLNVTGTTDGQGNAEQYRGERNGLEHRQNRGRRSVCRKHGGNLDQGGPIGMRDVSSESPLTRQIYRRLWLN
jgi:hypothetical protein